MRNRTLVAAVAAVVLFSGVTAGASSLVLDGSDSAPGTGTGQAACAGPLIVTNPVDMGGHDNNRVVHVNIDGDMTAFVGEAMLVEVDLSIAEHAYAVHVFGEDETYLTFTFDATTGDFHDTARTGGPCGVASRGGVTTVVVRGSSMAPTFHDGDPESGWHTAGDGNTFVDRWVVHRDDALGTLWFVVPRAGHVVEWLLDHPAVAGAGGVARSGRRPRGGRRAATRQPVGPVAADSDRARRARRDGGAHVGEWSAEALREIAEDVGENVLHHTSDRKSTRLNSSH